MVSKAVSRGLILLVFFTLQAKVFCQTNSTATTATTGTTTTTTSDRITPAEIAIIVLASLILFFILLLPCLYFIFSTRN